MNQDKAAQAAGAAGASSEAQGTAGSEAGQGRQGSARGGRGEVPASAEPPSGIDTGGRLPPKVRAGKSALSDWLGGTGAGPEPFPPQPNSPQALPGRLRKMTPESLKTSPKFKQN